MPIAIEPYLKEHEPAVHEFNQRLRRSSGDPDLVFSETAIPRWFPRIPDALVWNELFVASDGESVRGAYGLKQETFFVRGKGLHRVACYHHALSEGIVDRSYASVGGLLVRDALARQPLLYALGMGGTDRPLAKMLQALGFTLITVPFFFRVVHPNKFLREMQALREARGRATLMSLAANTGAGWLAIKTLQGMASLRGHAGAFRAEEVNEFSAWADELWNSARESISMASVRDSNTLKRLYPADDYHLIRLRVSRNGLALGWAVVGERRKDPRFGSMRVASVVDCWASPENALLVVKAAIQALEKRGVDLIVSNQSHHAWRRAFANSGFLEGPSTFVLATSRKLTDLLQPIEENKISFHVTRADGDGLPHNF